MDFVSEAAKTALVGVADGGDQSAVPEKVHTQRQGCHNVAGHTQPVQREL